MQSGRKIIENNPRPSFQKITNQGHELFYCIEPPGTFSRKLKIEAILSGDITATADFADDGESAHCDNIHVKEPYMRKGISTAMYVFAEVMYKKPLCNFWKNDPDHIQTESANALWEQPDRPFGHRKGTCALCG